MISLSEFWEITKARPMLSLFYLSLGALIAAIIENW